MEQKPRIYPIGVQNFKKLRKDGYIDKTALVHQLVNSGSYYFRSRSMETVQDRCELQQQDKEYRKVDYKKITM